MDCLTSTPPSTTGRENAAQGQGFFGRKPSEQRKLRGDDAMTHEPVRMEFDQTMEWLQARLGIPTLISASTRMESLTRVPPSLGVQCVMRDCIQREDGYLVNLDLGEPTSDGRPTGMLEVGPSQFEYGEEYHHDEQQPSLVMMFHGGLHITVSPLG